MTPPLSHTKKDAHPAVRVFFCVRVGNDYPNQSLLRHASDRAMSRAKNGPR